MLHPAPPRLHRSPLVRLTVAAVVGLPIAPCLPGVVGAAGAEHTLPDDPATNVVVLDSEGGFRAPPGQGADDFVLCVKADGTASIRTHAPGERQQWRMTPEEMNDLLLFLLDEQKFFALKSPVGNPKAGALAAAGGSWVLRVTADGRTHEVRGPMMRAGQAGQDVKRFERCIGRLRGVMAIVAVGGTEAANRFLKAANAVFTKEWPAEKPLALADLASGSVAANGEVDVVFVRGRKTVQARSPAIDGPITGTIVGR